MKDRLGTPATIIRRAELRPRRPLSNRQLLADAERAATRAQRSRLTDAEQALLAQREARRRQR